MQDIQVCVFLDVRLFLRGDRVLVCSTAETDKIALIPEDDFLATAPADLAAVSKDTNPHGFFMNRLAHELQLRQKCANLDENAFESA